MDRELLTAIINGGTGAAIAFIILVGVYRFANRFGVDFVKTQKDQAEAMGGLRDAIQSFVSRDNSEHREIIILQKLTVEKLNSLEESIGREERKV
jgi:hypothetical protein